eukprot:scaffold17468_cov54-Phaeocystis_antarctica.AAC.2
MAASNARGNYMATASVLCLAQDHHGSQRPAVNLLRAADYAWRPLLQPLRRESCFVASAVAGARRPSWPLDLWHPP